MISLNSLSAPWTLSMYAEMYASTSQCPKDLQGSVILLQFSFCSSLWIISIDRSSNLLIVSSATQEETIIEIPQFIFPLQALYFHL